MEGVTGVVLERATSHGFRRRLVLRHRNIIGNSFSLAFACGNNVGGRTMAGFLVHPSGSIGGTVRWSSDARMELGGDGVTSSCLE
jgi:hypothetical protein